MLLLAGGASAVAPRRLRPMPRASSLPRHVAYASTVAIILTAFYVSQAKSGGNMGKGGFTARVQSAAARNAAAGASTTSPAPATPPSGAAPGAKGGKGAK